MDDEGQASNSFRALDGSDREVPPGNIRLAARTLAHGVAESASHWNDDPAKRRATLIRLLGAIEDAARPLWIGSGAVEPIRALRVALAALDEGSSPELLRQIKKPGHPPVGGQRWRARAYVSAAADALIRENPIAVKYGARDESGDLANPEETLTHEGAAKEVARICFPTDRALRLRAEKSIREWRNQFQRGEVNDAEAVEIFRSCGAAISGADNKPGQTPSAALSRPMAEAWVAASKRIDTLW